jgi:hypothetical protein
MNENTAVVLVSFIFLGWMPILALCKGISWIIEAAHNDSGKEE